MSPYRIFARIFFTNEYRKFIEDCKTPFRAQAKSWSRIKNLLGKGTFWPKRYSDFQHRHLADFPITDYEFYKEELELNKDKSISPFNAEKILFWCESSGTTGKPKIYPMTKSYKKEFQMINGPFLYNVLGKRKSFLKNKILYFAATHPVPLKSSGIPSGFISAYNYANIPTLFKPKYAVPYELFRDRDSFFKWGALFALSQKIDTFVAITPSIVERYYQEIADNKDFYINQIQKLTFPQEFKAPKFDCDTRRRLIDVLKKEKFTLKDLWPNFETLICWKSSTCGMQIQSLLPKLGQVTIIDAPFSATEGWVTVPAADQSLGGALHCGGHVYEFINTNRKVIKENMIPPEELEPGETYEIFITNSMGFIRYRLRDIIKCTGFLHKSPIIEFVSKQGQALAIGQARISDSIFIEAIKIAEVQMPDLWHIVSADDAKNLILLIRESEFLSTNDLDSIDRAIMEIHIDYRDDRKEGLLDRIETFQVPDRHQLWARNGHAQTKPKIILQGSLSQHL